MKIYSKNNLRKLISSMNKSGRFAQGILLTGEKGSGRKTSAKYIAQSLLCEDPSDGLPCGICRSCRRIEENIHPDVIFPETEGKSGIYKIESTRNVVADCFTLPNDGRKKIYIYSDCEKLPPISQNALLKIIEEPPPYVCFIFTSADKSVFLPTILSRVISIAINPCTEEECKEALSAAEKYTAEEIEIAVSAYHGNIGKCTEYLEKGSAYDISEKAKSISGAILSSDRYEALKELSSVSGRENMREILVMLDKIIRDAAVLRIMGTNSDIIGCAEEISLKLSERITDKKANKIHEALCEAAKLCAGDMNINQQALCCKVCGKLF